MKKSLINLLISSVVAVVGVIGFWLGMPMPIVEQALSQVSQEDELAEAERLNWQAVELYKQGKYPEAIPLAEKALAIRQNLLEENHPDVATSLNNLAFLYKSQERYTEAVLFFQQSLDIRKERLGENHPDVATSMNNLAQLYRLQGRYTKAEPLYEQSLKIRKEQLGENHLDVATSMNNMALLYRLQGRYTKAEPFYEQSLKIRKEQLGENHLDVANSLNNLGALYYLQGRYTKAELLYEQSLKIRKEQLGENHLDVANTLNNMAVLYQSQGRYTKAEPLIQQSLKIRKEKLGDNHLGFANTLNNLAELYRLQGRYTKAEPLIQQSLDIVREKLGDNHPDFATSLNNLAFLYPALAKYREAEPLYKQSLAIRKENFGENHPSVAQSFNNLAELYRLQGRYKEAEPLYKKSLAIRKENFGENHPSVAQSLNNLAKLYEVLRRYEEAERLNDQALAISKELGENPPSLLQSKNNLALLYTSQGRYEKAELYFQQNLAIVKENFGENHPDFAQTLSNMARLYRLQGKYEKAGDFYKRSLALRQKQLVGYHHDVTRIMNSLAEIRELQGRYTEAEHLFQESLALRNENLIDNHPSIAESLNDLALLYYSQDKTTDAVKLFRQGLDIEEHNISDTLVMGDEWDKQRYMRTISRTTYSTISLNLQSLPNNPEATRLALKTIFERKGRILDIFTNSLQILRDRTDDSETQDLLNQLIAERTELSNLIFKIPEDSPKSEVDTKLRIAAVQEKVKETEDKLNRRSDEFRNLSQPITIEKIQQQIPADTALVELFRYEPFNPKAPRNERYGKPRYAAYVLYQTGEPQAIDLGEVEPIDKAVENLRKHLRSKLPLKKVKDDARELDKIVMQPVRQLLGDTKTILLSPDAALNLIPFEALVDENNQYLVENYRITYLTSGRDLLRQNPPSKQPSLVIADPLYDNTEVVAINRSIDEISKLFASKSFGRLEETVKEAKAIQTIMGLSDNQIKTKNQATENALKQVKSPSFLHIATHGFFLPKSESENQANFDNPLFRSGLVFAGVKERKSAGDNGVFTAYEATLLNLVGTQLVVLSACETGIGDISAMEGIYGLRRAFVIAGSESQMISLWKVEDQATKDLMVAYYQGLKAGKGRRDALLEIQRNWLQQGEYQHPYYWGSFIFSGDGKPIDNG